MKKAYASFFPTDPLAPESPWSKIVNDVQHKRLMNLITTTRGTILHGGRADDRGRIEMTIVGDVKLDDPLMEEYVVLLHAFSYMY
jgi:aldehyde dehydrogenase (NAD+)